MLAISDNAAEAIRGLLAAPEVPDSAGLRIAAPVTGEASFELSVATTPAEDDEVVEEQGAQVFLEPNAAALLDDKRLDAQVEAGQVTFAIAQQAAYASQPPGRRERAPPSRSWATSRRLPFDGSAVQYAPAAGDSFRPVAADGKGRKTGRACPCSRSSATSSCATASST
jgi:iron-sulfur cluster assembly protein